MLHNGGTLYAKDGHLFKILLRRQLFFGILGSWNTPETLIPATKPVISSTLYSKPCYENCIHRKLRQNY